MVKNFDKEGKPIKDLSKVNVPASICEQVARCIAQHNEGGVKVES